MLQAQLIERSHERQIGRRVARLQQLRKRSVVGSGVVTSRISALCFHERMHDGQKIRLASFCRPSRKLNI